VIKVFIAAVLLVATPAAAQLGPDALPPKADLKTLNCKDVFRLDPTVTLLVLAYLQAHYRAKNDPAIFDTEKMAADGLKLKEHCDAHPEKTILDAGDELFGVRL